MGVCWLTGRLVDDELGPEAGVEADNVPPLGTDVRLTLAG